MKRSFVIFGKGLLVLFLLHILFWHIYVNILTANGLQRRKEEYFRKFPEAKSDVWIIGDSHAMMGLNPEVLGTGFNFASTSEYYSLNLIKLKHLLSQRKRRPQFLILPLDFHSFSAQGNALLLQHELDDPYWSKLFSFQNLFKLESKWIRWWISARFFPYAGQFYRIFAYFKNQHIPLNANGFAPAVENYGELSPLERKQAARLRYRGHFGKFKAIDSLQLKALTEISTVCKREGIRLVLLSFPVTHEYLEIVDADSSLRNLKNLRVKISSTVLHLNFQNIFDHSPEAFSDPDHVNIRGAQLLSEKVKAELIKIRQIPISKPPEI